MSQDWQKDFYKNGVPTEVIVIEDTPPPSTSNNNNTSGYHIQHTIPYLLDTPAASTRSKRTRKDSNTQLPSASTFAKKRKKDNIPTTTAPTTSNTATTTTGACKIFRLKRKKKSDFVF